MSAETPFDPLCEVGDMVHDRWLTTNNYYEQGSCVITVSLDEIFAPAISYDVTALREDDRVLVKLNEYIVGGHQATERPVFLSELDAGDQRGIYSKVRKMIRHAEEQVIPVNHPNE